MNVQKRAICIEKCKLDTMTPIDANGQFDDSTGGRYGYRIYYDVHEDTEFFKQHGLGVNGFKIGDRFAGGQLEFTVDKNLNLVEGTEILLWISVENEDGIFNVDFVHYSEGIADFLCDLQKRRRAGR